MKAIDTRMKEIKLTKTTEEQIADAVMVDLKDKKKRAIDRNKHKIQQKVKEPKVSRISRRKVKDEFPEFQEVEDKFFDIVKRVRLE